MAQEYTLSRWMEFVQMIANAESGPINETSYVYRGHADSAWELKSSFHRIVDVGKYSTEEMLDIENDAMQRFVTQAHQFLPSTVINNTKEHFGWWGLMQHYGAPTRLLDWTLSPYVAAYNACIENFSSSGAVWVLHVHTLDEEMKKVPGYENLPTEWPKRNEFFTNDKAPEVVHFMNRKLKTDRMVSQQGIFSISQNIGHVQHEIINRAMPKSTTYTTLLKLIIPANSKIDFLHQLHLMNVSANSLFPGIDGLGKSINEFMKIRVGESKGL